MDSQPSLERHPVNRHDLIVAVILLGDLAMLIESSDVLGHAGSRP